jgi:hypothetical protein
MHKTGESKPSVKLPVVDTALASYRFLVDHPRDLLRIGWLPLILVFAVALYFGSFDAMAPAASGQATGWTVVLNGLAGSLVQGAISVIVLVAWHRLVMKDYRIAGLEQQKSGGRPGLREALYFLQMLLLSILFLLLWLTVFLIAEFVLIFGYLIVGGLGAIKSASADPEAFGQDPAFVVLGFIAIVIGLLPAFYVALRLSLVLPATATEDRRGRLAQAWAASEGNGWRMLFATILAMLPIEAFNFGIGYLASGNSGNALYYPLVLLASIGLVIMMAVLGTVLSRCYAFLQYGAPMTAEIDTKTPTGLA